MRPTEEVSPMAATSTMLRLGTRAPDFSLPDVTTGEPVSLEGLAGTDALLVAFICNHCPYVGHVRSGLAQLGHDYADASLSIVAISANDPETYPEDAPDELAREAKDADYVFPYLFDEEQEVAKAYTAACTPDFFLFDGRRELVYRGQFDDSRPRNGIPVTGADLRAAIDAVLDGRSVDPDQRPSVGCSIKWRPGNEPA
jgi:peroxiredoxin